MVTGHALVLGGGGVAGISWMTGLLAGFADAGQDVTGADLVIGTSAGATVGAQVTSGLSLDELYQRQVDPARQSAELMAEIDWEKFAADLESFQVPGADEAERLRSSGAFALAAVTVAEPTRRAVIESRLPSRDWPARPLRITAVDCASGEFRVFDAGSGVTLVDAVAASAAVPGVWPPVTVNGRRYMDGGTRSMDNADLAAGAARVTIVSPFGLDPEVPSPLPLPEVVAGLRAGGSLVTVISPDEASRAAMGANPLDPATRPEAASAGRAQGRAGFPVPE